MIKAKRLAVDEEGAVLVWTGDARKSPLPLRRHTTACYPGTAILADCTSLSCNLLCASGKTTTDRCFVTWSIPPTLLATDPEEYRELSVHTKKSALKSSNAMKDHTAQLLGMGLSGLLGYPQAHEDEAKSSTDWFGILAAMETSTPAWSQPKEITLAVRLGIHTGLVVVGAMGGAGVRKQFGTG